MPIYDYICIDCVKNQFGSEEITDESIEKLAYEARHSMTLDGDELLEAIKCPLCAGTNVTKVFNSDVHVRIRGYDWNEFKKNNASAMKRDMDIHSLNNNDPYLSMRAEGEKEYLTDKLKDEAKSKKNRIYFT